MNPHYATGTPRNSKGMPFVWTVCEPDCFSSVSGFTVTGPIAGRLPADLSPVCT